MKSPFSSVLHCTCLACRSLLFPAVAVRMQVGLGQRLRDRLHLHLVGVRHDGHGESLTRQHPYDAAAAWLPACVPNRANAVLVMHAPSVGIASSLAIGGFLRGPHQL